MTQPTHNRHIEDIVALSPTQEGILYHCLKDPELPLYLSQVSLQVEGRLEKQLLEQGLERVAADNECLRSVFRWEKIRQPVQVVMKKMEFEIAEEDVSSMPDPDKMNRIREIQLRERTRGFDLNKGPLLRVVICREGGDKHRILFQFHHIILDGWSLGLLLAEWFQTYDLLLRNEQVTMQAKPKYKTYLKWLKNYNRDQARSFWKRELESVSTFTKLPSHPQKKQFSSKIDHVVYPLDDLLPVAERFAKTHGVTVNSVFNAAWGLILQRYNDSDEAVFGLTVSGRPEELHGVDRMMGLFINTIPFIVTEGESLTAVDYVRSVHNRLIRYKTAEHLPLGDIQSAARLKGTESLFNHILVFENYPLDQALTAGSFNDFKITGYEEAEVNHYELTISILLAGQPMLKLECNTGLFDRGMMERMAQHFMAAVQQLAGRPEQLVSSIELLSADERKQLLDDFNRTERAYPEQDKTVYELFMQQAQATPDHTAVVFQNERLDYRKLADEAEQLASFLRLQGEGEGRIVALLMDWSTDMISAIMGVLGSGSAYLPIDPNYPEERIRHILQNSRVHTIVTSEQYCEMTASMVPITVILEQGNCRTIHHNDKDMHTAEFGKRLVDYPLAYVIYTSGSTGQPKGVTIDQRSFTEFVLWAVEEYEHKVGCQVLLSNSYAFDSSIQQIFPPLISGGTLHLLHPSVRKDAKRYLDYLKRNRINSIDEIPVLMNVLVEQAEEESELPVLPDLTSLSLGSEYVPISLVRKCRQFLNFRGKIINGYGPAETTVETCTYHFDGNSEDEISLIGKPRSNLKVYILDRHNRLCPVGVPGEICVSGIGLSRGYLNQPDLTNKRFIPNPFSDVPGDKMYKTGDAGQWLPDGNVQYIGRIDNQIKIRGYRVEPGEIEEALLRHPQIQDAVVVVQGTVPVLCAFLKSSEEPAPQELRQFLAASLPVYMIPSFYSYVKAYPQTPNGKINRKALEQTEIGWEEGRQDRSVPRHDLDKLLVDIWKNVLELPHIGIHSNFFELGGNSIQIMRVYSRLIKELPDASLEISDFFSYNTIAQLADYLMKPVDEAEPESHMNLPANNHPSAASVEEREDHTARENADIAIIGLGIRLPGIIGPDAFWDLLEKDQVTIREIPQSRKDLDPKGYPEKNYLRFGYLEGIDEFDPHFFGISPKFAKYMDPNQRIMLETAYHALEDAGYTRDQLRNRPVGVFMGAVLPTYYQYLDVKLDELLASNLPANLAGRLSYHFGFNGPSLVIDTACSSSLTALHAAVQSLRNSECEMAMVGGIHLDVDPVHREAAMESNIVSPSEICRAFSEEADGTIGGEGCICVLLKPAAQAILDNDPIYAVIKGSGVVQDGARSNGITAPSPDAQAETLLSAWSNARIDPTTISYIEAHGTGTKLGDPIEIRGIQKAYQPFTEKKQFIAIGSLKSNIGHLDSAAGLAGLVKTALSLKKGRIPASLHVSNLNSLINFEQSPVYVNTVLSSWESQGEHPARAGVSSFGLSGTNVHVVLEKFENPSARTGNSLTTRDPWQTVETHVDTEPANGPYLITLSGSSSELLKRKMSDLQSYAAACASNEIRLQDISYTLNCRRNHENYRFSALVKDAAELIDILRDASDDDIHKIPHDINPIAVYLQDYSAGAERLYDKLCQSGLLSGEEIGQYDKNIAEYAGHKDLSFKASYISFLCAILQLLRKTGLKFEMTGIGIGAAAADYINGICTFNEAVNDRAAAASESAESQLLFKKEGILLSFGPEPTNGLAGGKWNDKGFENSEQWVADTFTLEKGKSGFLKVLSQLYLSGHDLQFGAIQSGNVVSLPVYPFERKSYWFDVKQARNRNFNAGRQSNQAVSESAEHLLHRLEWKPAALKRERKRVIDGAVLIAGNHCDLSNKLAHMFRDEGLKVVQVRYGTDYRQLEPFLYEINIHREEDLARLLHELEQSNQSVGAYIHLPDDPMTTNGNRLSLDSERMVSMVDKQVKTVWYVGRQMGMRTTSKQLHLFHITYQADKVLSSDHAVNPMYSFFVSMNRSLSREYPQLNAHCIDFSLDDHSTEDAANFIFEEVHWQQEIRETACRNGKRYVKLLSRATLTEPVREPLRDQGVYLVTGGSGGVAMEICRSIAGKVNATFLLLGRTERERLKQIQLDEIRKLSDTGADVHYMQANIADIHQLRPVIEQIAATYGRVDGVIHAAGVMGNRVSLQDAVLDDYEEAFEAKVYGTVLLDLLLREHAPDFFLMFSSVDAVLSEKNLGPYTSANYFMDQYALQQRQLGRKFISIRWGGWQMTGMGDAARKGSQESHIHEIKRLSPLILGFDRKEGVSAFFKLIRANVSHALVTGLNAQDLQELKSLGFFELSADLQAEAEKTAAENSAEMTTLEEITAFVTAAWTEALELDEPPGLTDNYFSLGGDSIQGIDITVGLSEKYHLQLDANILFRHDTIESLSRFIHEQLSAAKPTSKKSIPKATPLSI